MKKDKLRLHAVDRALERYGKKLTQQDVVNMGHHIRKGRALPIFHTKDLPVYAVRHHDTWYFCGWRGGRVVTILPERDCIPKVEQKIRNYQREIDRLSAVLVRKEESSGDRQSEGQVGNVVGGTLSVVGELSESSGDSGVHGSPEGTSERVLSPHGTEGGG